MPRHTRRHSNSNTSPLRILFEDNHLLGVFKPAGMLVQGDRTGDVTLIDLAKAYLKEKYRKPGNVYLGLVHRLDRPVSGVMLYARTSKAASRLVKEFRSRRVEKRYFAVVVGRVREKEGELVSYVERAPKMSRIASPSSAKAKEAVLTYRVLARRGGLSLLEISPSTGRHHQIRVQLADFGFPIVGDVKYGADEALSDRTIALHGGVLVVKHPTRDALVRLAAPPPVSFPWNKFGSTIEARFE
ncbi:MAG: RNA pseudouridine synthase [Candidatus Latescibacterota bacterium]|nr:MAG: RNA pseudouridine synthase [Candidatus Latescibacterota bacterium]